MQATKIILNGEPRIKIDFPYNQGIAQLIKKIPGAKWSTAINAWHIPFSNNEFNQLKTLFPQIEYLRENIDFKMVKQNVIPSITEILIKTQMGKNVSVQVLGRIIILKLPKNDLDTNFIVSLRYSRWDSKQFFWIVPNYPGNLELINDYFKDRISELIIHDEYQVKTSAHSQETIKTNELLIIKTNNRRLKLIFGFNRELTYLIKKMPFHVWDAVNKWWTIPYSEKFQTERTQIQ